MFNFTLRHVGRAVGAALLLLSVGPASAQWSSSGGTVYYTGGPVGVGTSSPSAIFHVSTNSQIQSIFNSNFADGGYQRFDKSNVTYGFIGYPDALTTIGGFGLAIRTSGGIQFAAGGAAPRMTVTAAGNVGIGTSSPTAALDVVGSINVSGNIAAKYQDLAEWVPADEEFPAGTVVVLDRNLSNRVTMSQGAYDTSVAGVISAQPGIILGEEGPSKVKVATTGRVKVKVDATVPIKIGDLLVTSDRPGIAMRSEAIEVAGRKLHQPGTLIGKALEPLASGQGEILVLLSLQ